MLIIIIILDNNMEVPQKHVSRLQHVPAILSTRCISQENRYKNSCLSQHYSQLPSHESHLYPSTNEWTSIYTMKYYSAIKLKLLYATIQMQFRSYNPHTER